MRRHDTTIERLRTVPLFAACPRSELTVIARTLAEHHVPAGDVLIRQGDVGRDFAVIVDGTPTCSSTTGRSPASGPVRSSARSPCSTAGRRTATVVAETDLVTQVGTASDLAELIAHAPNMTRKLLTDLAGRLRAAHDGARGDRARPA